MCCLVGWKWPVACTETVVAPGDGERVLVVIVREEAAAVSRVWLCREVVVCEYEATDAACETVVFCRLGCCARKAARKPPKKGLLVVMVGLRRVGSGGEPLFVEVECSIRDTINAASQAAVWR